MKVSDGHVASAPATIAIDVAAVDDAPTGDTGGVAVTEDTAAAFTLTGHDPDGDALTFAVTSAPAHGQLTGTPPQLTYLPDANFAGTDTLQFTVNDGHQISAPATVTLQVAPVNDPPTTGAGAVTTPEDQAIAIVLTGSDADGDPLSFAITGGPAHGTILSGTTSVIYTPAPDFHGDDAFTYTVSDGKATTAGMASITVTPVNDPPTPRDDLAEGAVGATQTVSVTDNDTDRDGDVVALDVVTAPSNGIIDIVGDDLVYQPLPGFTGTDVVTYTVVDGAGGSATATLRLGVGQFPAGAAIGTAGGIGGTPSTRNHALSRDGRYVAFASTLDTLVSGDTNQMLDVFVYDRLTTELERVSVGAAGAQGNGASGTPSISADGRYVAFGSTSTNLVAGDTNGKTDIFVRDRVAHTTTRVSVGSAGAQATGLSSFPAISDDGQRVAFLSTAFDLVANDANGVADAFVRDLSAGTTVRASVSAAGGEADLATTDVALSGDGHVVAFTSKASNLVAGDINAIADVFVRDLASGVTERASVASTGTEGNGPSLAPTLSDDGRFVGFESTATTIVVGTTTVDSRLYVRDRQGITTTLAIGGTGWHSPCLSADGRYLVGYSASGNVNVRDRFAGVTSNVAGPNASSATISGNGRYIGFLSDKSLVPGQPTTGYQVFVAPNPR
ncbi:MAG: tandem-95 repeat protein [Deltaproteobacteria bacterium]|nr:tandem-95 repeat protein [Deltaproteobacteria bacterium]